MYVGNSEKTFQIGRTIVEVQMKPSKGKNWSTKIDSFYIIELFVKLFKNFMNFFMKLLKMVGSWGFCCWLLDLFFICMNFFLNENDRIFEN